MQENKNNSKKQKMKSMITKWRKILEQKRSNDYKFIVKRSSKDIQIDIVDPKTGKSVPGKVNQHGEPTGKAHMKLLKRGEEGNWEVASVASPKDSSGVGKEMYLLALELVSISGLSPDSVDISPAASNMWMNYLKNHPQVTLKEKESEKYTDESDPFKYIWTIGASFSSLLDIDYQKIDKLAKKPEKEEEIEPYDPFAADLEDYLRDIDENQLKSDTNRVSKVVIYDKNGKILLLRRTDGQNNWDLPGGHLKKDENHEEGAKRETKEETNLDILGLNHINDHENVRFFKCAAPKGDISLQPEEHNDFKWVNPKEIDQYSIRNSLKDAILTAIGVVQEDFQQDVKRNYSKMKFKLIGKGKNKYNIGGKMKKPSYKRSKSSPPGFGGS